MVAAFWANRYYHLGLFHLLDGPPSTAIEPHLPLYPGQPGCETATLTYFSRWVDTVARGVAVAMPATPRSHTSELDVACGPMQFSPLGCDRPLQRYYPPQTLQSPHFHV